MKEPISIALSCDEKYAPYAAVVIKSIFGSAKRGEEYEFHILSTGLSEKVKSNFREIAEFHNSSLKIYQISPERLASFPEGVHTLNTYLRLFLPEILPEYDKIIYLDADVLVLDSLQEIWDYPLKNLLGVVPDAISYLRGSALDHFKDLRLPSTHIYFNAGLLLINLKLAREIGFLEQTICWVKTNSHLMRFSDQDALNAVFAGQVSYLHQRWNLQIPLINPVLFGWSFTEEQVDAVANPGIIHYTSNKPWHREYKLPYRKLYFLYLSQTPWDGSNLLPHYSFSKKIHRIWEEFNWLYKYSVSKIRQLLGRNPKPSKDFSLEVGKIS
ncbi:glycosyltransferase family 8 protein [Dolichospermum circinale CS-537/01]|uniref:Glycosyltransferase family 8 protein n=1 Tax=Dolichospermum circinale CS-537/01 TaxID=3021739 RepID=A0ABT5A718_9CYAN|nr:glycosyltransferase family 8 protein [Dolichospermum circinale]MDB9487749.1 glycosyltransferase family 8 protein [Dolichospermum circinale CS-537/01]